MPHAQAEPLQADSTRSAPSPRRDGQNEISIWVKDQYSQTPAGQYSILANVSRDTLAGTQAAFVGNVATEKVKTQITGGFNYARRADIQLGWNVNVAHHVERLQLGGWNIADTVKGMQIGWVNISEQIDGTSLGLFTFSRNGLLHLNVSSEETGMGHLTFASGRKIYTAFDFGYTVGEASHPFSVGVGLGRHWAAGGGFVEVEGFLHMVGNRQTTEDQWKHHENHGDVDDEGLNHLLQAKVRMGRPLWGQGEPSTGAGGWGGLGVYAGLSFNALVHGDNEPMIAPWTHRFTRTADEARFWPGLEVGVRLGR